MVTHVICVSNYTTAFLRTKNVLEDTEESFNMYGDDLR